MITGIVKILACVVIGIVLADIIARCIEEHDKEDDDNINEK